MEVHTSVDSVKREGERKREILRALVFIKILFIQVVILFVQFVCALT